MGDIISSLSHPAALLIFLIGSGGLTTLVTAWFGWKKKHEENKEPSLATVFADRLAFERLAAQVERLADLLERAIDKFELHQMLARRDGN
jgi:hypothetical protein